MVGFISKDKNYLKKLSDDDKWKLLDKLFKNYQFNFGINCAFLTQVCLFACNENSHIDNENRCDFQKAFFPGNIIIEGYKILKVLEGSGINKEKIKTNKINLLCWQQMKDYFISIRHPCPNNILEFDISNDFMFQISILEEKFYNCLKNRDLKSFKIFLFDKNNLKCEKCISKLEIPNHLNEDLKTLYYLKILYSKFEYFYPKWIRGNELFFKNIRKTYSTEKDMYKFCNNMGGKYSLYSSIFLVGFQIVMLVEERGIFGYKYPCQVKMINEFKDYFDFEKHFFLAEKNISENTNVIKQFNFLRRGFNKIIRPYMTVYDKIKISNKWKLVK